MTESKPVLMKGNEAIGEGAVRAGCRFFFGYPITPQNELPAYMARRLAEEGGVFLQAESELAAINMVYGAGAAGARVMTSSSSPGISLKQEGISYLAAAEVPGVIVNIVRGGPGLGNIGPAQSDYYQATRGGGHGDYRLPVLAPANLQEAVDLTMEAFDLADRYRNPVMILGDGILGQMMEPVRFSSKQPQQPPKPWATTGRRGREHRNIVNSLILDTEDLWAHNQKLDAKYREIARKETRYELVDTDDADLIVVAYGTTARIARKALQAARAEGLKAGLLRPITLWPFPNEAFERVLPRAAAFLAVEMSMGQMVDDVRLAVEGRRPVDFYGVTGGEIPEPVAIVERLRRLGQTAGKAGKAGGRAS